MACIVQGSNASFEASNLSLMFLWAQQDSERFGPRHRDEHQSPAVLQHSIQPGAHRVTLKTLSLHYIHWKKHYTAI